MDELSGRLSAVLSSPEEMDRLARMARQLMGQIAPEPEASAGTEDGNDLLPRLQQVMQSLNSGKQPLLTGLSPYLRPERREKLARALRLASALRLAGAALGSPGDGAWP